MRMDMCLDMYMDMFLDMCMDMCMNMCFDGNRVWPWRISNLHRVLARSQIVQQHRRRTERDSLTKYVCGHVCGHAHGHVHRHGHRYGNVHMPRFV